MKKSSLQAFFFLSAATFCVAILSADAAERGNVLGNLRLISLTNLTEAMLQAMQNLTDLELTALNLPMIKRLLKIQNHEVVKRAAPIPAPRFDIYERWMRETHSGISPASDVGLVRRAFEEIATGLRMGTITDQERLDRLVVACAMGRGVQVAAGGDTGKIQVDGLVELMQKECAGLDQRDVEDMMNYIRGLGNGMIVVL